MNELPGPRLITNELDGARKDCAELIMRVISGVEFEPWLAEMPEIRSKFVRDIARPTIVELKFHADRVAADADWLPRVPAAMREKVRRYADTLIARRRSSEK